MTRAQERLWLVILAVTMLGTPVLAYVATAGVTPA